MPRRPTRWRATTWRSLDRIARATPREISVKPTQLGLDLDRELCYAHLRALVERAHERGNFVWIDMEQSRYVDATLDLCRRARALRPHVGVCLQAYLRRTPADLAALVPTGAGVRLVKGAYKEPPELAFPGKARRWTAPTSRSRAALLARTGPRAPACARCSAPTTPGSSSAIRAHAPAAGRTAPACEFHLLYGIQRAEQERLAREGARVRVLISYGAYWFPWYMRRLAERPANVLFVVRSLFRARRHPMRRLLVPPRLVASAAAAAQPAPPAVLDALHATPRRGLGGGRLREDPLLATAVGDHRYDDRLPSVARGGPRAPGGRCAAAAWTGCARSTAPRLAARRPRQLRHARARARGRLAEYEFGAWRLPINADSGFHTDFAQLPARRAARPPSATTRTTSPACAPSRPTCASTSRIMREGLRTGFTLPRVVLEGYDATIRAHVVDEPEHERLLGAVPQLPARRARGRARAAARGRPRGGDARARSPATASSSTS